MTKPPRGKNAIIQRCESLNCEIKSKEYRNNADADPTPKAIPSIIMIHLKIKNV